MINPIPIRYKQCNHTFIGILKAGDWFYNDKKVINDIYKDYFVVACWQDGEPTMDNSDSIENRETLAMVRDEDIAHLIYREYKSLKDI